MKLLDFDETELEQSENLFALIVLTHLRALKTRGNTDLMMREKVELLRKLNQRGYNPKQVADLYRVVDYIMTLSKMRDELVRKIIREKEAESEYPLTSFEELALERGVEQGLKQGTVRSIIRLLRARFGVDASWLEPHLMAVKSLNTLDNILNEATRAESMEAFLKRLSRRLRVSLRQPQP